MTRHTYEFTPEDVLLLCEMIHAVNELGTIQWPARRARAMSTLIEAMHADDEAGNRVIIRLVRS